MVSEPAAPFFDFPLSFSFLLFLGFSGSELGDLKQKEIYVF